MPSWNQKPELEPSKTPTALDIAWAAGIYEGEGTIRQQRYGSATVGVTQKDPEILYRLRDWFGGAVKFSQCVTVPFEQQCHVWRACGDKSRLFIAQVYGFLSARRKSQVDATRSLEFLHGESPVGLTILELKDKLEIFALSRMSQDPEAVRRREKAKTQAWYRNARKSNSISDTQERVM